MCNYRVAASHDHPTLRSWPDDGIYGDLKKIWEVGRMQDPIQDHILSQNFESFAEGHLQRIRTYKVVLGVVGHQDRDGYTLQCQARYNAHIFIPPTQRPAVIETRADQKSFEGQRVFWDDLSEKA